MKRPDPAPQNPRRPAPGTPPKRRRAGRRALAVLVLLLCLAAIAGVTALLWLFLIREQGPTAPEVFDFGPAAGAWAKNENGVYFNPDGEPIAEAVYKGIDVSRYQGEVDWEKAKAAGIDFALLRCGFGSEWNSDDGPAADYTQDDPQWRRNADECTRLGIPFGTYLYSYATTEERARREADHVARLLGLAAPPDPALGDYTAAPYRLSCPVYYDLEDASITNLYPDEAAALAAAFFDQLESHGYTGEQGIYASLNWVRGRLQDPGFDRWRGNFWIARFNTELGYSGPYRLWQSSFTEPGAAYGVQSETVDIDFAMQPLRITGIGQSKTKSGIDPTFENDTWEAMLWLAAKDDRATLQTDVPAAQPAAAGDGAGEEADANAGKDPEARRVFWQSSDEAVATVDKNGTVRARGEGTCTVTATRADGRLSAACTVRVGAVTVPVYATGALHGVTGEGSVSLADVAALAAAPEAVLLDAGGSLQGTADASLTGGMDMMTAFSDMGYDLQAVAGQDLAFGISRLRTDLSAAAGPTLASNLRTAENAALFDRAKCWNNNRISNGMNCVLRRAGHSLGFFALVDAGADLTRRATVNEAAPLAADPAQTAAEQVAALRAAGAEAVVCILPPTSDTAGRAALQSALAELGVDAVIDGALPLGDAQAFALPTLPAATGFSGVGRLDVTFAPDGTVTAVPAAVTADELRAARTDEAAWTEARAEAYDRSVRYLGNTAADNAELREKALFTAEAPAGNSVSFGTWVAAQYALAAQNDAANWGVDAATPLCALAGGVGTLPEGEVSRAALLGALPTGARLQLVLTTAGACTALADTEGIAAPWQPGAAPDYGDEAAAVVLIADTAALAALPDQNYTLLRDYGDVFWFVRMAIGDATGDFAQVFALPQAG